MFLVQHFGSFVSNQYDHVIVFAEGMFFSLLNYCIEVYGNVWGLNSYD